MLFRNLTLFRFPTSHDFSQLAELLPEAALKPVGPLELTSAGFIPPLGRDSTELMHRIGDAIWLAVGEQRKILPAAVVADTLARRIAEVEQREGRKLGGRARKRLKDEVLQDLLPKALVQNRRTDAILDLQLGVLFVDTASRKAAAAVASEIRRALGSFPAMPVAAETAPRAVLTSWLAGEPLPEGMHLGEECELRTPIDYGAVAKLQHHELLSEEVDRHLESGKQVARLGLNLDDRLGFVLGDDLVVRKLRFFEAAVESPENTEHDDLRAELDARFALMAGEARHLFQVLEQALRIPAGEG